jgi:hypothetical protein
MTMSDAARDLALCRAVIADYTNINPMAPGDDYLLAIVKKVDASLAAKAPVNPYSHAASIVQHELNKLQGRWSLDSAHLRQAIHWINEAAAGNMTEYGIHVEVKARAAQGGDATDSGHDRQAGDHVTSLGEEVPVVDVRTASTEPPSVHLADEPHASQAAPSSAARPGHDR